MNIKFHIFKKALHLDIFSVQNAKMVFGLCNLLLKHFSFLYIQTLHNDCSHIEDVHLLFCAHLIIFSQFLTGVELRIVFTSKWLGVYSLCNL